MARFYNRISEYPLVEDFTRLLNCIFFWVAEKSGVYGIIKPDTATYVAVAIKDKVSIISQLGKL